FTEILRRTRATRRTAMKYAVWPIAFVGVFLVGFWAGRIPLRPVPVASVTWEADPVITEYVQRVSQNIVKNSDAKVPITIRVIRSDEANAVSLPGGFFYVNTGLICESNKCSSDLHGN